MKFDQVFVDILPAHVRLGRLAATTDDTQDKPSEQGYWATLFEDDHGNYFFFAKGVRQAVSAEEYLSILHHPYLHYFSTALRVHLRMVRLLQ